MIQWDSLTYHQQIQQDPDFQIKVVPAFRLDKAMVESPENFRAYPRYIEEAADVDITNFATFMNASKTGCNSFDDMAAVFRIMR